MSNLLIAIDPGKASGFAVFDYTNLDDIKVLQSAELNQMDTVFEVDTLLTDADEFGNSGSYEIVMEKFTITAQTGKNTNAENWSPEIIGAVRYLAWLHKVPFSEQTPAEAKNFVPNDRMKNIGIWHIGGEGHARDALRHGVLYLVKNKGWRPSGLLATDE